MATKTKYKADETPTLYAAGDNQDYPTDAQGAYGIVVFAGNGTIDEVGGNRRYFWHAKLSGPDSGHVERYDTLHEACRRADELYAAESTDSSFAPVKSYSVAAML